MNDISSKILKPKKSYQKYIKNSFKFFFQLIKTFCITGQVQVEDHVFACPFDVMANRNVDILFGLNVLRRHHCCIDLKKNVLRFGDGTEAEFLSEEAYRRGGFKLDNIPGNYFYIKIIFFLILEMESKKN